MNGVKALMERVRTKSIYALLAGAVLGVIVMPIAFAGAAGDPQATASASVKKQLKKLKQQINQLQQQVEDLSKQPGPQGPGGPQGAEGPPGPATGPAGGDLTGTYPNPLIGPDAIGTADLADNAVTGGKILNQAVSTGKIADNAVISSRILDGEVQATDIGSSSVGSSELKNLTAVVGSGVTVNAGTPQTTHVTCPPNQLVIGGGYAWQDDEPNSIIFSAPSEADSNGSWVVRGMVDAGSNNLFAWANCLAL